MRIFNMRKMMPFILVWILSRPGHGYTPSHEEISTPVLKRAPSKGEIDASTVILASKNFTKTVQENDAVFVNFFAPWCSHCQRLAPTWARFAYEAGPKELNLPVVVAKVDCVAWNELCREQKIRAYPTMTWFQNGEALPQAKVSREVPCLLDYARQQLATAVSKTDNDASDGGLEGEDGGDAELDSYVAPPRNVGDKLEVTPQPNLGFRPLSLPGPHNDLSVQAAQTIVKDMCKKADIPFGPPQKGGWQSERGGTEFQDFSSFQVKVAPTCSSASNNARGSYNSFFSPCEFQFHVIPDAKPVKSTMKLSTACSSENLYNPDGETSPEPIMDYIRAWPDECVGDYTRCYAVSKDVEAKVFLSHFCRYEWEIPPSVTHISVNCQADKAEALKKNDKIQSMGDMHLAQVDKHHREKLAVLLLIVLLTCCGCWACLCLGYNYAFVPYLKVMKKSRSDPDLKSLLDPPE